MIIITKIVSGLHQIQLSNIKIMKLKYKVALGTYYNFE